MPTPVKDVLFQVTGGAAVPVPIVFPTTLVAKTQGTNATATAILGADTIVLAANANRKFAQIVNTSGSAAMIAFGAAATALSVAFPNNGVFTLEPDTIGEINQQAVHVWNPTGSNIPITVYEE